MALHITWPPLACLLLIVQPGAILSQVNNTHTHTWPSTRCRGKYPLSQQTTLFHCLMVQLWCSHSRCRCFWHLAGINMGTLTGLQTWSPICSKPWCTVFWHRAFIAIITFFRNCSHLAIIWPLLKPLKSLRLPIFPGYNTSTSRTDCSLAA